MENSVKPICVKNQYTFEQFNRYFRQVNYKGMMGVFKKLVMFFICPLLMASLIYGAIDTQFEQTVTLMLIGVFAMFVIIVTDHYTAPRRRFKRESKRLEESPRYYLFLDEGLAVTGSPEDAAAQVSLKYENIHRVTETEDAFYIYYSPYHALIMGKPNIIEGTEAELAGLLREKTGEDIYSG